MSLPELSVVVPIFDEEPVLEHSLEHLVRHLDSTGLAFELVCVDDGSRDASLALLWNAAAADPRLRVLAGRGHRGKGAALRDGVLSARGDRIVFMDADLSTDLAALEPVLAALDASADVVFGSRRAPGALVRVRQSVLRVGLGRGFSRLASWLVRPGLGDFTCGFKGFRRPAARAIFQRSRVDRWAVDAEIAAIAAELDLALVQVPVTWSDAGPSKVHVLRDTCSSLGDLLRISWRRRAGAYR